jgi:hypothetical protein
MPLDENPFFERLKKMPVAIAVCAIIGGILGAIPAAIVASHVVGVLFPILLFLLIMGGGFSLGVVVGVTLDTLVFKPWRDKEEKRQRRLRRRLLDKAREAGLD